MTTQEVLQGCIVEGLIVKLPAIKLDEADYKKVAKKLKDIGGKWKGGKTQGFAFVLDPTERLAKIAEGKVVNLKQDYQFFETPDSIADKLVDLAGPIKTNDDILEPSAGKGSIIRAIWRKKPEKLVFCCELMEENRLALHQMGINVDCFSANFMDMHSPFKFDKIIANPPFSKNQDVDHVKHMYEWLKDGGRLVAITSIHWRDTKGKKEGEFKNWLKEKNAKIIELKKGDFKSSGTMTETVILVIDKK